jgi:glyoxylase-like metal-dependent hydrolase (beta-lactamase superfamily II)
MNNRRSHVRRGLLPVAVLLLTGVATDAGAQLHLSPPAERCSAAPSSPGAAEWLRRAATATLPADWSGRVLRYRAYHDFVLWEQSDRMYEPFIPNVADRTVWYDFESGLIGRQPVERAVAPGAYTSELVAPTEQYFIRDTVAMRIPQGDGRAGIIHTLNPWDVLRRWQARAGDVRLVALCSYRDFPRVVLSLGDERLYLATSDATPMKLEREEAHYLFGQVRAEYLWSTWWGVRGGGRYPIASFLQYDGQLYHRYGLAQGTAQLVARDSAPRLTPPATVTPPPAAMSLTSDPDTVRISGNTWLLVTRAYTQAVTLQRDTVFVLDATSSEARARADSAWVARLFPGRHPVVLVVTDLAWPHISGVRFWVARGATIVSHAGSESFLRRVIDRKWTRTPDALEQARAKGAVRLRFVGVKDSLRLGGGAITVHAMQGQSTEGAVGAWIPGDRFFWAGDYVQNDPSSPYARDVAATLRALGIAPAKVGAQHVSVSDGPEFLRRFSTPD